jgi:hypothetical protein
MLRYKEVPKIAGNENLIKEEQVDSDGTDEITNDLILNVKKGFALSSKHLTLKQQRA